MLTSVWERVNGKNSFHPLHLAVLAFGLHQVKLKTLICNIKKIDIGDFLFTSNMSLLDYV